MLAADLDSLLAVLRKYPVRGFNLTEHGFEVVFEPTHAPEKERKLDVPSQDTTMPTRAELDAEVDRIRKGAKPK